MISLHELIVVTGSNGLAGRAVCAALQGQFRVVGLDDQEPSAASPCLTEPAVTDRITVEPGSADSLEGALRQLRERHGSRIASFIHLAEYVDFSGEPSPLYNQINVQGTERLLLGLKNFAVEQFVFTGTMLVHGPAPSGERLTEEAPLAPRWAYPQSKLHAERLVSALRGEMPVVLLRLAGVYDDHCHAPELARQIQRINERWLSACVFPGDSSHGQAALHTDDLAALILLLIRNRTRLPILLPLLAGEPDTLSYDQLQSRLGRLIHGEEWHTHEIPKSLAKSGVWIDEAVAGSEQAFIKPWMIDCADDHYALDVGRAQTLLGWQPRQRLRAVLERMVDELKSDPLGWYRTNQLLPPDWLVETGGLYERRKGTRKHAPR